MKPGARLVNTARGGHRRRGSPRQGARGRAPRWRGARRVRHRAHHGQPALRVPTRGRDAAPRRLDHARRRTRPGPPSPRWCGWRSRGVRPVRRERLGRSGGVRDRPAVRAARGAPRRACSRGSPRAGSASIVCSYLGRIAEADTRVLTLAILKGILGRSVHEPVSFVNAPMLARERGITVSEMRSTVSQDYVSLISLRADTDEGPVSVAGTLVGKRDAERVMQVDDFDIEMAPAEHMVFFTYTDRPGHHREGGHDPRRARREHRDDGRGPQGRAWRGVDVPDRRRARATARAHEHRDGDRSRAVCARSRCRP